MSQTRRTFLKQSAAFSLLLSHPALAAQAKKHFSRLASYDALGLAELIRTKQVSALELVDEVIRRVERVNPKINAVLTKNLDFEMVRDRARKSQLEGMFAGVPVMLKNLQQYKDANIDSGSRLFAQAIAKRGNPTKLNSPLIDAMERSGMLITGITNAPELGLIDTTEPLLHGPTRNPWNLSHTAGGSSGGTAAAIAAGIVPFAHGNDGGGSIRIPACQCGVFGLKPTRSRELGSGGGMGVLNIASNLCLSRSVRDTAAFLSVVENKKNPNLPSVGFISGPSKKRLRIALASSKDRSHTRRSRRQRTRRHRCAKSLATRSSRSSFRSTVTSSSMRSSASGLRAQLNLKRLQSYCSAGRRRSRTFWNPGRLV